MVPSQGGQPPDFLGETGKRIHPAVVGEVTIATIANHSNTHKSNHLSVNQWFALPSVIHNNQPLL